MNKKISLLFLLLVTLACATSPSVNIPQQPADVNLLETMVVQTAGAAQTRTAVFIPTSTYTPTPTRTPSSTPTSTPTFLFLFPTFTLIPTQTPIGQISSGGGSGVGGTPEDNIYTGQPWSCRVVSTQPPKGALIKQETTFYAYWTILNTGTTTWDHNSVDIVYTGGWRHEGTKIQDLGQNIATGGKIVVGAMFIAPNRKGEFGSHFVLKVGNRKFCGMEISFEVIK